MANKNRKKKTHNYVSFLPAAMLLGGAVCLMLLYIWVDARGRTLGNRINALEQQRAEIQKRYDYEQWRWEALTTPANIEKALARYNVAMIWPGESSIVRLQEPDGIAGLLPPKGGLIAKLNPTSGRSILND